MATHDLYGFSDTAKRIFAAEEALLGGRGAIQGDVMVLDASMAAKGGNGRGGGPGSGTTDPGAFHRFFVRVDYGALDGNQAYTCYSLEETGASPPVFAAACGQMEMLNSASGYTAMGGAFQSASTWLAMPVDNTGAMIPLGAVGSPGLLNNMAVVDTGQTVQGLRVNGLTATLTGIYRYDITAVVLVDDWPGGEADVGQQLRLMLSRNGTPITAVDGVQGNDTHFTTSFVRPYSNTFTSFPKIGPWSLSVGGHVRVEATTDYLVPFMQIFTSTGTDPSDMRIYGFSLSMNRVAPLP